jgi:hypothetical protein
MEPVVHTHVTRVISGGQTGADRAALDVALELDIPHGGYVPAGRRAEDGRIAECYRVTELETDSYDERTRRNVAESDGTLIVSIGPLTGGSATTRRFTRRLDKPLLHVDLAATAQAEAAQRIRQWLADFEVRVLNVAGPRESTTPGIHEAVRLLLREALMPA